MIEVNTSSLKNIIDRLNSLISEYEEIKLNLFHQLKDSCINWHDGNSTQFENQIYIERQESDRILQSLTDQKVLYEFIYNQYINLGKTIKCDLNQKENLITLVIRCEESTQAILNDFHSLDHSFDYPEYNDILNQAQKVSDIKAQLANIKETINDTFNQISTIEKDIQTQIKNLKEVKINDFNFSLL